MERFFTITVVGFFAWAIGGWTILLGILALLNVVDFITGMLSNWGSINSKKFYQGIIKKGMMWVWIMVANLISIVLEYSGFNISQVFPDVVAAMFIGNEIISLAENSEKLGVSMPNFIKKALSLLESETDKKEGELDNENKSELH